jgi:hypothetical protein
MHRVAGRRPILPHYPSERRRIFKYRLPAFFEACEFGRRIFHHHSRVYSPKLVWPVRAVLSQICSDVEPRTRPAQLTLCGSLKKRSIATIRATPPASHPRRSNKIRAAPYRFERRFTPTKTALAVPANAPGYECAAKQYEPVASVKTNDAKVRESRT